MVQSVRHSVSADALWQHGQAVCPSGSVHVKLAGETSLRAVSATFDVRLELTGDQVLIMVVKDPSKVSRVIVLPTFQIHCRNRGRP